MQGLTIIVASRDPERFRSALEIAAASAALGKRIRLFLQQGAVALLVSRKSESADLLEEALALGAGVTVCQSGLALAGMEASQLPAGVETGGLIELLSTRGDDQLLMV